MDSSNSSSFDAGITASASNNPPSTPLADTKGRSTKPAAATPTETPTKRGRPKGSSKAATGVESGKLRSVADFFKVGSSPTSSTDAAAAASSTSPHTPAASRGRGRGRPRGAMASSTGAPRSAAVSANMPSTTLMLDTFFVMGNKRNKQPKTSRLTKEDSTALRQCARKAGNLRLPFVTYQSELRSIVTEPVAPSTPVSTRGRGRGGSTRGRGRGRGAAAAASGSGRHDEQAMDVQTSTPSSSRGKKEYIHRGGRKIQCAAAVGDESEAAAPPIDLTKPRQTLYSFPSNLTLQSLPDAYQSPTFPDIMSQIKSYMPRFGLNNSKLCQEVNCSNSTIYFLLTNTYKYDLTNFNIRMRHYLWRTDRWCVERTRQWIAKSNPAAAAAAGGDWLSMPAEVAASGVSQSDWNEWLDCTLTLTAREAITDIVFQHAMECELELTEKFEYQTPIKKEKPSGRQETLNFTPMDTDSPSVSASGRPVRTARVKSQVQYVNLLEDEDDAGGSTQRTSKKRKADSDSDASMRSDGEDDDDDDDDDDEEDESMSGADSDGSRQRSKKRKMGSRNTERTRSNVCTYPHTLPTDKLLPSDYHQPSALFQSSNWRFDRYPSSTTSTVEDIFMSRLDAASANVVEFTSNGQSFTLNPIAAKSVVSQSNESNAISDRVNDSIDAFIFAGGAVSGLDWCPVGGSVVPPVRANQYLVAAMDTSDGYARVLPGVATPGILLLYSSLLTSSQPPQCRLALTHRLGRCIALQWYPHSIDESSSDRSSTAGPARIGVLAAIFSGGAIQVRAIPEPPATNHTETREVTCIDFLSLPGFQLCAPQYPDAPLASPTSLTWSHAPLQCQLAIGMSNGCVHVFDLQWSSNSVSSQSASTPLTSSIVDCIASVESGLHVVTGVAFHPTQSFLLALCTSNGETHVYDVRATSRSLLTSVSTHEACRGILWPKVSTPHLQMILVLQRGQIYVISLANTQATKMDAIEAMLPATNAFPIPAHAIYQQVAVGARASLSDAMFLVAACSDGGCYAAGVNVEIAHKVFGSRSAGPSIVRWQPNTTMSDDNSSGGTLDISDYFGAQHASSRDAMYSLKKQRIAVQKKFGCPEPTQSAANNRTELHCVAVNPNLVFPRVIASAGPAGLIRVQCLRSL